jgi:hypothetical protein
MRQVEPPAHRFTADTDLASDRNRQRGIRRIIPTVLSDHP